MLKHCNICGGDKHQKEFPRDSTRMDGLHPYCKACKCEQVKQWQRDNPDKSKARKAEWYQAHKELTKQRAADWRKDNPDARKQICRVSDKKRRATIQARISHSMSDGMWKALRKRKNGMAWEQLVGYTLADLMQHLESKFLPGMTWDNYGAWHIDHIVPRTFFCYTTVTDQEFLYCWSLDNLQPLWAPDNLSKGDKLRLAI